MADRLEITGWHVERWGGGSDRHATNLPTGLTVVLGQNEEGKSSVAAALAWLLAGPGGRKELRRFGLTDDMLQASLSGTLQGANLQIRVSPKVLSRTSTGDYNETLTGDHGGRVIDRAALRKILGGIRHDEYRSYYWVDAERIPEDTERTDEVGDRSLFASIAFGDLDPISWAENLEKKSNDNFGIREGRTAAKNSVCLLAYNAELAQHRLTEVAGSQQVWAGKKIDRDAFEKSHGDTKQTLEDCRTEIKDLDTALKARQVFDDADGVRKKLAELEEPTKNDVTLKTSHVRIRDAIQDLRSARTKLEAAEERVPTEEAACGAWVDLVDDAYSDPTTIERVRESEEELRNYRRGQKRAEEGAREAGAETTIETGGGLGTRLGSLSLGIACVLALATVVVAVGGNALLAAILGASAATALVVAIMWYLRASVRSDDPVKIAKSKAAEAKRVAEDELQVRNQLLAVAGIAEDLAGDEDIYTADRLEALATLKNTRGECTRLADKVEGMATALQELFPMEIEVNDAEEVLQLAINRIEKHEEITFENIEANLTLREAVGGDQSRAQRFLEENDDAELNRLLDEENGRVAGLELEVTDTGDKVKELTTQMDQIGSDEDYLGAEADLQGTRALIRRRTIIGLADQLGARLLKDTAHTHLGDNTGKILKRASELAKRVAVDWSGIRMVEDISGEWRSQVESSRGEFQEDVMSTGGRSLLNLALRLATITVEAERLPVLLPVILDDPFVHLDDTRRELAFAMLNEFSTKHQVLYFTCHEEHARMAEAAGANLRDLH